MTNIRAAAKIVRPFPMPGDRLELEISEPLGLHIWSEDDNNITQSTGIQVTTSSGMNASPLNTSY